MKPPSDCNSNQEVSTAGRIGLRRGKVSELTGIVKLAPGGAKRLRLLLNTLGNNFQGADKVGTLHDMRFVFLDNDTRLLFATAYDGDWDTYIDDFVTKIPDAMDLLFCNLDGWPGINSPRAKDFIAGFQIMADTWYVASPNLTVAETKRLEKVGAAVEEFLDKIPVSEGSSMSSVTESLGGNVSTSAPTLDLHEIQATVLRPRRRRTSALTCSCASTMLERAGNSSGGWHLISPPRRTGGMQRLPGWRSESAMRASRRSGFRRNRCKASPRRFASAWPRVHSSLATMGSTIRRIGSKPFGTGQVHIGVSAFSDSEDKRRRALAVAREQYEGFSGVSVLAMQDFGAQPGDRNSLGYKDGIDQPAIEGSGVEPQPGYGRPIKAGEFILGYPGEAGIPLPMPQPDILGRNGTYAGFRKYQTRVGAFNRFLRANGSTEEERELVAAKLVGRWRSGAPLTLAPDVDNPTLGADPKRNNDFDYANDPHGRQIPFGAHIRRMNPRDTELTRLTDVNLHRLIRRGTTYGLPYDPNALSEAMTRCRAAPSSCSSAPRRWRRLNFCNRSGSTTAISSAPATSATRSSGGRKKGRRSPFRSSQ